MLLVSSAAGQGKKRNSNNKYDRFHSIAKKAPSTGECFF